MADEELPQDVMVDIMSRLPVKSLMRFKCLSKSYLALITDPSFIKKHFELSKNQPALLAFHFQRGYSTRFLSHEVSEPAIDQELPQKPDRNVVEITPHGPSNGIFCLHICYDDLSSELRLWNPSTREVKVLPSSQNLSSSTADFFTYGFGMVSKTNDYKVVSIVTDDNYNIEQSKPFAAEVYNLSTNSWTTINTTESAYRFVSPVFGSYLKGIYHWLTIGLRDEAIICFNMSCDKFSKMEFPIVSEDNTFQQLTDCNIAVMNDSIAYVKEYCLKNSSGFRIEIWVMNEYGVPASWNKRYVIGPGLGLLRFLGFWKEDEILVGVGNQPLFSCNPDAHQLVKEFPIQIAPSMFYAFRYVESIFPHICVERGSSR